MQLVSSHAQIAVAAPSSGTAVNSYKVSVKRGTQSGVGVTVSGSGAWAKLKGDMTFSLQHLDSSKTYDEIKTSYGISAGVSGFWSWLGIGAKTEAQKQQIHSVFHEVSNSQKVDGHAHFDLFASGQYPNVQVDASAYVLILQIEDAQGNTFNMFSTGAPESDTGAQDQNGNALPQRDNNSTISI